MEQRTVIAIVLSLLFLIVWNNFFSQKPSKIALTTQALTSNNQDIDKVDKEISNSRMDIEKDLPLPIEKVEKIETEDLIIYFSNIGGTIKRIHLKRHHYEMPVTNIYTIKDYEKKAFSLKQLKPKEIVFSYQNSNGEIIKKYIVKDQYLIESSIETRGNFEMSNLKIVNFAVQFSDKDIERYKAKQLTPADSLLEYSMASGARVDRKGSAHFFDKVKEKKEVVNIDWVGFRDRYFCFVVKPQAGSSTVLVQPLNEHSIEFISKTDINSPNVQTSSSLKTIKANLFVGPQDATLLKKYKQGFERIVSYKLGGFMDVMSFGLTDALGNPMLGFLKFMHKAIPNYGVCIILFATGVYFITYPLTAKTMSSMKKMQALQPEMVKINEKYKNDPQKKSQEIMELYKKHKVNPFSGCLPSLLQMPIFVTLYQVLWRSFILKGEKFLWVQDLSEPDRFINLQTTIPFIGEYINLLPILATAVMFFQQRLSMKNSVVTDPEQVLQQKIMMAMLPVMILFFFYQSASGVALYFFVFYGLSAFTQWKSTLATKTAN